LFCEVIPHGDFNILDIETFFTTCTSKALIDANPAKYVDNWNLFRDSMHIFS
jgi:hypothetical protein